jgi:hypothetical protein
MMKELTIEQLLELYKKFVIGEFPKDDQPEFSLGELVRVRDDACSIYGECSDDRHHDGRWERELIAGLDEVRQKRRGEIGFVQDISRVPMKCRNLNINREKSNYIFEIKYEDGMRISMVGEWLEHATPLFIEGKEIGKRPTYNEISLNEVPLGCEGCPSKEICEAQ